jgi:hypothetical protein
MNRKVLMAAAAVPVTALALAACTPPKSASGGVNFSYSPGNGHHQTQQQTQPPEQPSPPVTFTTSPELPAPQTVTASPMTDSQITQCILPQGQGAQQTLVQLTSQQAWGNLDGCLQIPTAEFDRFVIEVVRELLDARNSGQLGNDQQCQDWADNRFPGIVRQYQQSS